jgi:hypothetical protein
MDLTGKGCCGVDGIKLVWGGDQWDTPAYTVVSYRLHKMWGAFLIEQLLASQKELRCVELAMEPCSYVLVLKHKCAEVCFLFMSVICYVL